MRRVWKDVQQGGELENPPAVSYRGEAVRLHSVWETLQSGGRPEKTQEGPHRGETVLLQPVWKELQSGGESEKTSEDSHRRGFTVAMNVTPDSKFFRVITNIETILESWFVTRSLLLSWCAASCALVTPLTPFVLLIVKEQGSRW